MFFSNRVSCSYFLREVGAAVTLWGWEAGLGRVSP